MVTGAWVVGGQIGRQEPDWGAGARLGGRGSGGPDLGSGAAVSQIGGRGSGGQIGRQEATLGAERMQGPDCGAGGVRARLGAARSGGGADWGAGGSGGTRLGGRGSRGQIGWQGDQGPNWGDGEQGARLGAGARLGGQGARLEGQGEQGARLGDWLGAILGGGVISKHPPGTVWHETTLTSHKSGILHSLIFTYSTGASSSCDPVFQQIGLFISSNSINLRHTSLLLL